MGSPPRPPTRESRRSYEIEWTTISYRTIAFYVLLGLLTSCGVLYLIAPNYFGQRIKKGLHSLTRMGGNGSVDAATARREAHFVNIDGTVRVKKGGSNQWIRADYNTALEKGDFVQTQSDGVARIIFADQTNYLLKPDSLIVIEESREDPVTRATRVAVQVTSGAADLSTGKFEVPGSTSQVAFADAVASLAEESRAVVRNDPEKNVHQFTVDQGEAAVTRGSSTVRLGQYEQVAFEAAQPGLIRSKVIAPPTLLKPVNMELTITKDPQNTPIHLEWSEIPGAIAYHLLVSPSTTFSNFVVDKRIQGRPSAEVTGLEEGVYYWAVSSIDAKGVESPPSTANRFNLVEQADTANQAFLEITKIIQHGRVLEIQGRTEPGSSVIINNEQVFSIAPDGTFRHFTAPLPKSGSNQITITAQNRRGDTNTIRKTVVVQ
ncbi:MAG TPA: hypothetical protein VFD30_03160 [Terriglobia bacterium]|nr:hypothetical protein [Terriglobia bacterium]